MLENNGTLYFTQLYITNEYEEEIFVQNHLLMQNAKPQRSIQHDFILVG